MSHQQYVKNFKGSAFNRTKTTIDVSNTETLGWGSRCASRTIYVEKAHSPLCNAFFYCVLVTVVGVALVAHMYYCTKIIEERLEARLEERLLSILEGRKGLNELDNRSRKINYGSAQHLNKQENHRIRRKAPTKKEDKNKDKESKQTFKFIHLVGRNSSNTIYDVDRNFIWDSNNLNLGQANLVGVRPIPTSKVGEFNMIKITKTGMYMVYSQIAVVGKQQSLFRPPIDCAHETVLTTNTEDKVILKSLRTQMLPAHSIHSSIKPIDTNLQMGIFHLKKDNSLRVRPSKSCDNDHDYTMTPEHSYFGVVKLG
ncbi:uncharacterized protein LOC131947127 [Physella acuta]|uniref:uncharacterized protein LOC131947127 n=1 Tax=Physella acuta TaxID=109671 RepID=UPI0027DE49FA|nr:uncharacterized protein LOC131947127 [Physella acuta]